MTNNKIIFLDFDGVINGNTYLTGLIMKHWRATEAPKFLREYCKREVTEYSKRRIKRIAKICRKTEADVVLTSSWRESVYDYYMGHVDSPEFTCTAKEVAKLFKKYGIEIVGLVNHTKGNRTDDIVNYLLHHKEINKYIILDDEYAHLEYFMDQDVCIFTTDNTPYDRIKGRWFCRDGIRNVHVKKAIEILNS